MLPPRIRVLLTGDLAKAASWRNYGQRKALALARSIAEHPEYAWDTKNYTEEDGSVRITIKSGVFDDEPVMRVFIDAKPPGCTPYLESGIANAASVNVVDSSKYSLPGQLFVGSSLAGDTTWGKLGYAGKPSALVGIANPLVPVTNGQQAFCLKYVPPPPPAANATQVQIDAYALQIQAGKEDLLKRKQCLISCPASVFSGKLRLYVQALYGRKFKSPETTAFSFQRIGFNAPTLIIPSNTTFSVGLNNAYSSSNGIYTDEKWNYYLLNIYQDVNFKVRVIPMIFNDCGKAAQKRLQDFAGGLSRELRSKYEAVALQNCTASAKVSVDIDTGLAVPTNYAPLSYGWTFKWDGSEAHIIVHTSKSTGTFHRFNLARHLVLNIQRHADPDTTADAYKGYSEAQKEALHWNITGSALVTDSVWWPRYREDFIWVPDWVNGGLMWYTEPQPFFDFIPSNAPLYCFYDKNDVLQVITYTCSQVLAYTESTGGLQYSDGDMVFSGPSTGTRLYTKYDHGLSSVGSFSGTVTVAGIHDSYSGSKVEWGYTGAQSYQWFAGYNTPVAGTGLGTEAAKAAFDAYFAAHPGDRAGYYANGFYCEVFINISTIITHVEATILELVIPWLDCSSVYLGKRVTYIDSGNTLKESGGVGQIFRRRGTARSEPITDWWETGYHRQFLALGAGWTTTQTVSTTAAPIVSSCVLLSFDGAAKDVSFSVFPAQMLEPETNTFNTSQTFATQSSAVYGDIVGYQVFSGRYPVESYSNFLNSFVGFA